jgi:hypothetical protein
MNTKSYDSIYEQALNGSLHEKLAFITNRKMHARLNATFKQSLPIMQNENHIAQVGLLMPRNSMLFSQLNYVVSQLVPAGITQHLDDYGLWYLFRPYDNEVVDPRRILSLSDLEFGFVLWFPACLVSFVCFICELVSFKMRRKFKFLFGVFGFFQVLRIRLNEYHDTC